MRLALAALIVLPTLLAGCTGGKELPTRLQYNGLAFAEDECGPPVNATAHLFAPTESFDDLLLEVTVDGERVVTEIADLDENTAARPRLLFDALDLCSTAGKRHVEVRVTVDGEVLVDEVTDVSIPRARVAVVRVDAGLGPCGTEDEATPVTVHVWNGAEHAAGRTHVIVDSIYGTWDGWIDRVAARENETAEGLAYPRPSCNEGATAPICVSAKANNGPVAIHQGQLTRRGDAWVVEGMHETRKPCYSWVALGED